MAVAPPSSVDGRSARWDKHNHARRQAILHAATEVVASLEPGAEIHVRQIADKAGLSRTVVYRHFKDRADLDQAVQTHILRLIGTEVAPAIAPDGSPTEIIRNIVGAYVGWTEAHPSLHRFAEHDRAGDTGPSPMDASIGQLAQGIEELIVSVVEVLHVSLTDEERRGLDPLVFGLVGFGFTAVGRWASTSDDRASADTMIDFLSESIWHMIAGLAARRGLILDPHTSLQELLLAERDLGSSTKEGAS